MTPDLNKNASLYSWLNNSNAGCEQIMPQYIPVSEQKMSSSLCSRDRVDAFMFLPTMTGQWNLDNRNLAETDTTLGVHTGELPIST